MRAADLNAPLPPPQTKPTCSRRASSVLLAQAMLARRGYARSGKARQALNASRRRTEPARRFGASAVPLPDAGAGCVSWRFQQRGFDGLGGLFMLLFSGRRRWILLYKYTHGVTWCRGTIGLCTSGGGLCPLVGWRLESSWCCTRPYETTRQRAERSKVSHDGETTKSSVPKAHPAPHPVHPPHQA